MKGPKREGFSASLAARSSLRRRRFSSSLSMVACRRSRFQGFTMKSPAPRFIASTAVATLPWAVTTTMAGPSRRSITSKPFMSGRPRSTRATSGRQDSARARASCPVAAWRTS